MNREVINLFCIPFSGGNAYSYAPFKKHLPENIRLITLELPGRGTRIMEPLLYDIASMTEDLFRQIEHRIEQKYALFGHSLGALLGFLLCQTIARRKLNPPVKLFISGQKAASLIAPDERYLLPDNQFADVLRNMGGTPEELLSEEDFLAFFLPVVKADFQAIGNYTYQPADSLLSVPFLILTGKEEEISDEDVAKWQPETNQKVDAVRFDGGHFFIFNQTAGVCRLISRELLHPEQS